MRGATHVVAFALFGLLLIAVSTRVWAGLHKSACAKFKHCSWYNGPELSAAVELVVVAVAALVVFTIVVNGLFWLLRSRRPRI